MKEYIRKYFQDLKDLFDKVAIMNSSGKIYQFYQAIDIAKRLILKQTGCCGKKLLFIGNGASASIASHIATDFWKNAGIPALSFNDAAGLTCISNDFGFQYVFERPLEMFANDGDILFAISSSGKSENILRGVRMALSKGCHIITLSGLNRDNPLQSLGNINFYVPHSSYGPVEVMHLAICHCIVDSIIYEKTKNKEKRALQR